MYTSSYSSFWNFIDNRCNSKVPNKIPGEKDEVYVTAGLKARPLTDVKFESTPERIARGKYLTEGASHCFLCHNMRVWSKPGYLIIISYPEFGIL